MLKIILFIFFIITQSQALIASGVRVFDILYESVKVSKSYKVSKINFLNDFIKNPHLYQREFELLSNKQKIDFLSNIAVEKKLIKPTEQLFYINKFNNLKNGDKLLLSALQKGNSLKIVFTTRRITKLEKYLITSKNAIKSKIFGRTIVKRKVFQCNQQNIKLMLKGNAPFGFDNRRIELHHLKQQKDGNLIELTQTEHNEHSKILHRYVKNSEITDRNSNFANFRKKYWKSRASDCIARRN
jgi:hypothetical protein